MGRIPLPRKTGGPHESNRYERHEERRHEQSAAFPEPAFQIGDRVVDGDGRAGEIAEILDPGAYRPVAYRIRYEGGETKTWAEEALLPESG